MRGADRLGREAVGLKKGADWFMGESRKFKRGGVRWT